MKTVLITSAAYVSEELAGEFGKLPPAFLPIGNRRLFELQYELLDGIGSRTILTVPSSFRIAEADLYTLNQLGIEILPVVEGLSLCDSVVYALNVAGVGDSSVVILHGDTLYTDIPSKLPDVVVAHEPQTSYNWATYKSNKDELVFSTANPNETPDHVLSGYFTFSSARLLVKAMTLAQGNFLDGLNRYQSEVPIQIVHSQYEWLDFGHVQTYFQSRWFLMAKREFNQLKSSESTVTKYSHQSKKIDAEAAWYKNIPKQLRAYTPALLGHKVEKRHSEYTLRNEYLTPLSDLMVFGRLSQKVWSDIFASCNFFLAACAKHEPEQNLSNEINSLYGDKLFSRLKEYSSIKKLDLDEQWVVNGQKYPSLRETAEKISDALLSRTNMKQNIIHGDFCFSNILYDFRRRSILVIDPRGYLKDFIPSVFGDPLYDVAKLCHSVIGRYDYIQANRFELEDQRPYELSLNFYEEPSATIVESTFLQQRFVGIDPKSDHTTLATASLFLSMLPLHNDAPLRQSAFLAQGLSLAWAFQGEQR